MSRHLYRGYSDDMSSAGQSPTANVPPLFTSGGVTSGGVTSEGVVPGRRSRRVSPAANGFGGSGTTVNRGSGVSVWHQIEQVLLAEISGGAHEPGTRLPSEFEIAERFGVNRHTVRRAVSALAERGVVRVERGNGTFVESGVIDYLVGRRTRFSANLTRASRVPSRRLLSVAETVPEAAVATALLLGRGKRAILLETIGEANGLPISLSATWFPAQRFATVAEVFGRTHSITATLAEFGVSDYTRKSTKVTARLPSPLEASLLHQPKTQPVLVSESIDVDTDGVPISFAEVRFCSERVQLVVETDV